MKGYEALAGGCCGFGNAIGNLFGDDVRNMHRLDLLLASIEVRLAIDQEIPREVWGICRYRSKGYQRHHEYSTASRQWARPY